jgi:serine/threonine protein kinase/cytochrome c-type biogenesis protein CcmH/NrfG
MTVRMPDFQPMHFGKYVLLDKLATGGMAQVYRAKITGIEGFEKLVAIKMILSHLAKEVELVTSFVDEAKLAALLNHQNTVQIHDFGSIEDSYFICMEYLSGKDLRACKKRAAETGLPISLEYALYIASRICAGLDYAHALKDLHGNCLNLIHRDISPQNIFMTYDGAVKILDFGIAKAASQSSMTQCGMIKGKVSYMSPEQASGEEIDQRSDIFSVGILLYEMVTGVRMFAGESTIQILEKVRRSEYKPPRSIMPDLPRNTAGIINRALAREREKRYQTCGEMLADLEECMSELSMRPTARGLAQYMHELFRNEIIEEDAIVRKLMTMEVDAPESVTGPGPGSATLTVPPVGAETGQIGKTKRTKLILGGMGAVIVAGGLLFTFWPGEKAIQAPGETKAVSSSPTAAGPKAEESSQGKAKALVTEATGYLHSKPDRAKSLLAEAVTLDPANMEGYFQLGLLYLHLKEYPKSIDALRKVTEIDPRFPDGHFNLGYAYAMKKSYGKAEESYKRAVELAPPYLDEALFNLAMVQRKQGKNKESRANLQKALKVNPDNQMAQTYLKRLK